MHTLYDSVGMCSGSLLAILFHSVRSHRCLEMVVDPRQQVILFATNSQPVGLAKLLEHWVGKRGDSSLEVRGDPL